MFAMCSCVYVHFGHACVEQNLLIKLTRVRYCYREAEVRGSNVSIFEGSLQKRGSMERMDPLWIRHCKVTSQSVYSSFRLLSLSQLIKGSQTTTEAI